MSDQDNKVIPMWNREAKKEEDLLKPYSFEEIEKKNNLRKERIAKERASQNKSVLRNYNIKG